MDLVVSNRAERLDELVELARAGAAEADVVELRLDTLGAASEAELRAAFAAIGRPVLAAANGPEAFGTFAGTDDERLALLERADRAGAAWIDVPWTLAARCRPARARRVVSRHVLDGTPAELAALLAEVESAARPGDRLKLVTQARCAEDGLRVLALAHARARLGRPIVAFASGAAGAFTRVLAPVYGSLATYAAPAGGTATAPGQLTAAALRAAWPARGPGPRTRICAVLGRPIAHSLSPPVHAAAMRAVGFDGVYVACEPASLAGFLALCDARWIGLGVTMPFKEDAARLAGERDEDVAACGAANTLVRGERGWHAANTDAGAIRAAVLEGLARAGLELSSARVVVVGTGGAARAALHALRGARARTVAGRDAARRDELARTFGARSAAVADVGREPCDVLVHATPLGSRARPGESPLAPAQIAGVRVVLDAVYDPAETPLLAAARAAGAIALGGAEWFLRQAAAQFEHVTGSRAESAAMSAAFRAALHADAPHTDRPDPAGLDPRPIALVGLRASGKTTLGRELAARLGRAFVDLDEEVAREDAALRGTGELRPAGEILRAEGEPRFRDLEARALERVLARTEALVLATGGGVVERAANRLLLRTRARCVWLDVPVAELERRLRADPTPRPSLTGGDPIGEVALLAGRRAPLYRDLAPVLALDPGRALDGAAAIESALRAALTAATSPAPPSSG